MAEPPKDKDQEKGDEILRRLLMTPQEPKTEKGEKPKENKDADRSQGD
jgi:hypothetical protein